MMDKKFILFWATLTVAMSAHAQQQKNDTLATATAEGDDRNVMLNAADSYKPREIQILNQLISLHYEKAFHAACNVPHSLRNPSSRQTEHPYQYRQYRPRTASS